MLEACFEELEHNNMMMIVMMDDGDDVACGMNAGGMRMMVHGRIPVQ